MLNPKQQLFVQEYLIDLNAAQAAIRAGYSKKTAKSIGYQQLQSAEVREAIEAAMKARAEKTAVTAEWVLRRLQHEAEFVGEGSSHAARVTALALAMKHLGMFKQDAPNTGRPVLDISKIPDDVKRAIAVGLRLALPPAG